MLALHLEKQWDFSLGHSLDHSPPLSAINLFKIFPEHLLSAVF